MSCCNFSPPPPERNRTRNWKGEMIHTQISGLEWYYCSQVHAPSAHTRMQILYISNFGLWASGWNWEEYEWDTNAHVAVRRAGFGVAACSEKHVAWCIWASNWKVGLACAWRLRRPTLRCSRQRPPALNPLRWVCAHQIITSARCLPWRPPRYLAAGAINIAASRHRYCNALVQCVGLLFFFCLLVLFILLSRSHWHMDRVRQR